MKGLVVFSFGLRDEEEEPNPCNVRLAEAVKQIVGQEDDEVVIVAQWEVSRALKKMGVPVEHTVALREEGQYLDSDLVWKEAMDVFSRLGINEVIPVAQSWLWLQITKVKMMIRKDDYKVISHSIGWIGFDKESTQWWTRDPLRLPIYAVLQQFTGHRGHSGKQHAG